MRPSILQGLPSGDAGIRVTLDKMVALVNQYKTDAGIHELARRLVGGLPPQNSAAAGPLYVKRLQHFVRDNVQYVYDVDGVETLQTPPYTLQVGTGDCDDKATLLNTMLASIGYPTLFIAVSTVPTKEFTHVLAGVKLGTREIPLETILPGKEPGWFPGNTTRVMPWRNYR